MNSPRFKVLIIGCGNMAGGYDLHQPADALPMGHAKAFSQQGGFELAACIDPNGELRRAYQNRWQVPLGFDGIHNLGFSPGHFDLISICSPSPLHITHVGQPVFDHWNDDPSVSICLETQTGVSVQINVAHAQDFAMFEMQAVTERAVISMEDGGACWRIREPKPSHTLQGYRYLNQGDWMRSNGSPDLSLAVSNVYEALKNNAPLACTGLEALQVHTLTEAILHQALGQSSLSFIKREAA